MPTFRHPRATEKSADPWLRNLPAKHCLQAIENEAALVLGVAERDLTAPVPTTPGSLGEDPDEHIGGDGRTVAIRTGDHGWRVTLEKDTMRLDRALGPADLIVSGEPSELMLWLWRRRPTSAVIVDGDDTLVPAFRELLYRATQ